MNELIDALMVLAVLLNLRLLGSSRLASCIRTVAIEGIALGLLPLLLAWNQGLSGRLVFLAVASIVTRGVVFPWVLLRAQRNANVQREVQPFINYPLSILTGVLTLVLSLWLCSRLPLPQAPQMLLIPVAMSTILVGLLVIVSRRLAISQVLGYIVMENGIYVLGLTLVQDIPALVELGVLLDAFVAVFVMSIVTHQISREFDHIDADQMDSLKG
ncbi:MAG: hydrogenase [Planctomycetes bacterium]|nr:hydrogenase [Planctomycetota bacterium]